MDSQNSHPLAQTLRREEQRVVRCDAHPRGSMLNPVAFDELTCGQSEIFVEFSEQLYRLSRTRLGKLILTKASNPIA